MAFGHASYGIINFYVASPATSERRESSAPSHLCPTSEGHDPAYQPPPFSSASTFVVRRQWRKQLSSFRCPHPVKKISRIEIYFQIRYVVEPQIIAAVGTPSPPFVVVHPSVGLSDRITPILEPLIPLAIFLPRLKRAATLRPEEKN
ncbi:UNVERIFIED_CONTAM: hypothetical protein Sangu_0680000 [Sesamum angustifolium]|uniref:Uncharacterized protein n=1 Tax=Sesamum angustifolium TaxID=2727405 RepID=A0AAW2PRT3_9LAMI